ncbi:MAG: AAA family ATPase [Firmicutes bacterium]|nr:AAA family ATPase [Bacillota bacterium]
MDSIRSNMISGTVPSAGIPAGQGGVKANPGVNMPGDSVTISNSGMPVQDGGMILSPSSTPSVDASAQQVQNNTSQAQTQAPAAESFPRTISMVDDAPKTAHSGAETKPASQYDESYVPGKSAELVQTKSTVENLTKLARSVRLSENALLVGPTGAGKTAIVKYLAHLTQNGLRRINLNDMTDITEIIGGFKPNQQGRPEWHDGIVVESMKKGQWLLLDEVNLADPAILERLNSLLDDDRSLILTEKNNEVVKAHENFRCFATMNPSSYAGRKKLSAAMMNRFHKVWMDGLEPSEMVEVLKAKSKLPDKTLLQMCMFHQTIADMAEHKQIGKKDGNFPFSLRDMQKWIKRINHYKEKDPNADVGKIIWREARHVYEDRFIREADRAIVEDTLKLTFSEANKPADGVKTLISENGKTVKIGDMDLNVNPEGGAFVPSAKARLVSIDSTNKVLEKMAKCVNFDEPVLLVGPTAAGKTAKVKYLANLTNNNLRRYNLSMQTDTTEFIGGFKPTGVPGEYKWSDGILVDAMKKGDWVVLDEINLAEPAILERINSLLDGDRSLVLTERENERVEAHPNFRVFATMNPATGDYGGRKELSLAMRNRFSEIWDPGVTDTNETTDIVKVFMKKVPEGDKLASRMVTFQTELAKKVESKEIGAKQREGFVYTIRNLQRWSEYMKEFTEEAGAQQAFLDGAEHIYASEIADKADRKAIADLAKTIWETK